MRGPARYFLVATMAFLITAFPMMGGAASAQVEPAVRTPVPSMPIFSPSAPAAPAPTIERGIDANGNERDTTTTYRTGPYGTYTDHTAITTAPPGNPSLGETNPH